MLAAGVWLAYPVALEFAGIVASGHWAAVGPPLSLALVAAGWIVVGGRMTFLRRGG